MVDLCALKPHWDSKSHTRKADGNTAPRNKRQSKKKLLILRLATWNVRTMCPGLSDDLRKIDDTRKTAIINSELKRLDIDVATLQETRLAADGVLREEDYTFYWQGRPEEEPRMHGVGLAVKNSLLPLILPPSSGTERILSLILSTSTGKVNILSAYAPTL